MFYSKSADLKKKMNLNKTVVSIWHMALKECVICSIRNQSSLLGTKENTKLPTT